MDDTVVEYLRKCCVQVKQSGCGFFIGPNLVVTCAHVLGQGVKKGDSIELRRWESGGFREIKPDAKLLELFDYNDLALLGTDSKSQAFAPLSKEARVRDDLVGIGFPQRDDREEFDQFSTKYEGRTVFLDANGRTGAESKFKGGQVEPGFSGGPLLNLRTRRVMGVVVATRNQYSDLGGWAIEISVLKRLLADQQIELPSIDQGWPDSEASSDQLIQEVLCYLDWIAESAASLGPPYRETHHFDDMYLDRQVFQIPKDGTEEFRAYRTFLTNETIRGRRSILDPTVVQVSDPPPPASVEWSLDQLLRPCRAVVSGRSGFGKTWLLRREARRLALRSAAQLRDGKVRLGDVVIPLFFSLSEIARHNLSIPATLALLATEIVKQTSIAPEPVVENRSSSSHEYFHQFIELHATRENAVILLDNQDIMDPASPPINEDGLRTIRKQLAVFSANCPRPTIIVTAREPGYMSGLVPPWTEYELLPFGDTEIAQYTSLWFQRSHNTPDASAPDFGQVVSGELFQLLRIPIVLPNLLTTIDETTGKLSVRALVDIAKRLTDAGNYELAYRIEAYCRTCDDPSTEPLMVALRYGRDNAQVDAYLEAALAPAVLLGNGRPSWAVLQGGPGTGKSTALRQMEHYWSLPADDLCRPRSNAWLLLGAHAKITADDGVTAGIRAWLQEQVTLPDIGALTCHQRLSIHISDTTIASFFALPVCILIDNAENLRLEQLEVLERKLRGISDPNVVFILTGTARRPFEMPGPGAYFTLQPLQPLALLPIGELWNINTEIVEWWSDPQGRETMQNSYLLTRWAEIVHQKKARGEATQVPSTTRVLSETLNPLLNKIASSLGENTNANLRHWLSHIALRLKGGPELPTGRRDYTQEAAEAQLLQCSMSEEPVFRHNLLQEYFAALGLQSLIDNGQRSWHDTIGELHPLEGWEHALRILVGLDKSNTDRIIAAIAEREPCLACRCATAFPPTEARKALDASGIDLESACPIGKALANDFGGTDTYSIAICWNDPRITVDDPLVETLEMDGFRLGKYPVTNMEYARFVKGGGYGPGEHWDDKEVWERLTKTEIRTPNYWFDTVLGRPNYPVVGLSYWEAMAYCRWLRREFPAWQFSLPSSHEWDSAADPSIEQLRSDKDGIQLRNQLLDTTSRPIGSMLKEGRGFHGLCGGVWEWCDNWVDDHPRSPITASNPGCAVIVKGGPQAATEGEPGIALINGRLDPWVRSSVVGFRLCVRPATHQTDHHI